MSAVAGRSYRRIVPRRNGVAACSAWGWRSVGVDVYSGRGRRGVRAGVCSRRGCWCVTCAAGGGMRRVYGNPVVASHICPADSGVAGRMRSIGNAGSVGVRGIGSDARRGMRVGCVPAGRRTRRVAVHRGRWRRMIGRRRRSRVVGRGWGVVGRGWRMVCRSRRVVGRSRWVVGRSGWMIGRCWWVIGRCWWMVCRGWRMVLSRCHHRRRQQN